MFTRRISLLVAAFFCLTISTAQTGASLLDPRLIVHEWGTFTTVATADGILQGWRPLAGPSELPSFVYAADYAKRERQSRPCISVKCQTLALVRMETPVLYFYADRATELDVKVDLPDGRLTEWYPQAREHNANNNSSLHWRNVTVSPASAENFPQDNSRSHYYPARATAAAPLRVIDGDKTEHEKFLFYRGVGNFSLPLQVRLADGQIHLRNSASAALARVIIFEKRGAQIGWRSFGPLKDAASAARPALAQTLEPLLNELERALVMEGLYAKEAAAMVATWRDSWFEEGLRVLYILPRQTTDRILPITITPQPTELTRVMVGRAEIIAPEMQQEIVAALARFASPAAEERAAAVRTVQKYGRFAEPVLRQELSNSPELMLKLAEALAQQTTSLRASR